MLQFRAPKGSCLLQISVEAKRDTERRPSLWTRFSNPVVWLIFTLQATESPNGETTQSSMDSWWLEPGSRSQPNPIALAFLSMPRVLPQPRAAWGCFPRYLQVCEGVSQNP